jgi:hypothetical protein
VVRSRTAAASSPTTSAATSAGMGGRWLETPNAWDPTRGLRRAADQRGPEPGVYFDDVDPGSGSVRNKPSAAGCCARSTATLVGRPRPHRREIVALLPRDPAQAERWFLNRKRAGEARAFDIEKSWRLADTDIESRTGR